MEKEKITFWYSVPLALIQLLTNGLLEQRDLSSLKWVLFGGEVFAPKYLNTLMKIWPTATFCNVYGPAEINQCTNYSILQPPNTNEPIPLGKIWFDAKYRILDDNDVEVNKGTIGELVVNTKSMMLGYWNNQNLTENHFLKKYRNLDKRMFIIGPVIWSMKMDMGNWFFKDEMTGKLK